MLSFELMLYSIGNKVPRQKKITVAELKYCMMSSVSIVNVQYRLFHKLKMLTVVS
jgi:hypothetical protein